MPLELLILTVEGQDASGADAKKVMALKTTVEVFVGLQSTAWFMVGILQQSATGPALTGLTAYGAFSPGRLSLSLSLQLPTDEGKVARFRQNNTMDNIT